MAALAVAYLLLFDSRLAAPLRARVGVGSASADAGRLRRAAVRALDATGRFGGMRARDTGLAVALCVLRHLIVVVAFVWFAAAIGVALPFATAGWVQSGLLLALMLPIAYAGLGVREAGLVVFLGLFGVDSHAARRRDGRSRRGGTRVATSSRSRRLTRPPSDHDWRLRSSGVISGP
jgi:hypothetical protein